MVVKLSHLHRVVHTALFSGSLFSEFLFSGLTVVAMGVAALSFTAAPLAAQENTSSLSDQLFKEAKAAQTLEDQNRVLQKIEQVREGDISEELGKYLVGLEAWLLHQRGETHAKQAAEATARGDKQAGRDLDAKAMEDFDAAIGLDPKRWKSYHHRGVCYALTGDFEQALNDFSKTVELRPDYENAWFNRGEIHYEMGQFAKAVADYDQAIQLKPKDAGFYTSRGHAQFQLRRFKQALSDYSRAVALDPKNSEYYAHRGDAYRSLGDWEKAANDFKEAIELDKSFGRAYQSAAWLMATCPAPQFRNPDLAVRSAKQAIKLDGDSDYIYLDTLAAALANNGQFDTAETVLRRAIDSAPQENVAPLRQRLNLYRAKRPFRQSVDETAQRPAKRPKRS